MCITPRPRLSAVSTPSATRVLASGGREPPDLYQGLTPPARLFHDNAIDDDLDKCCRRWSMLGGSSML